MLKKISQFGSSLVVLAFLLASCRTATPETPTATAPDANAVFTAAAQTADARMTELAATTPTQAPVIPTETQAPPTATLSPTIAITATATTAALVTSPPPAAGGDLAEFVADVTVPDGSDFSPGQTFVKTWQIKNSGSTTWTTDYSLVFISGAQMGAPASVPLTGEVAPEGTVNVSVNMTAPSDPGNYRGFWQMSNAGGQLFDTSVYVDIDVTGSTSNATQGTPVANSTPGATATGSSSGVVSNVAFSVDDADVSGTCPHTFNFTANFNLSQAASVTYRIDAETGFTITLPDAVTTNLPSGPQTLTYNLEFGVNNTDVEGWARFHITAPSDVASERVNFSLTCS